MTNQEHKAQLTGQIETCLKHAKQPDNYNVCYIGSVDRSICMTVNLLSVNGRNIRLIPSEGYFNYLSSSITDVNKIEF